MLVVELSPLKTTSAFKLGSNSVGPPGAGKAALYQAYASVNNDLHCVIITIRIAIISDLQSTPIMGVGVEEKEEENATHLRRTIELIS